MKPLRVALIVKPTPSTHERENRNMGYWSYEVPEFTWDHFVFGGGAVDTTKLALNYDLIFHEDGGNWCTYSHPHRIPVVYMSIDSTLTDDHYRARFEQSRRADLTLVDHDRLTRFPGSRRLGYCVNDHMFKPLEKTTDIAYHCMSGSHKGSPGGEERSLLRAYLGGFCKSAAYSYRSGALGLPDYAASMGSARIVVNWPRTPINRPHRVFDAMACGACLVTGKLPPILEDYRVAGVHYVEYEQFNELPALLDGLLKSGEWQKYAEAGRQLVMGHHTWAIRARELREMLAKELGL